MPRREDVLRWAAPAAFLAALTIAVLLIRAGLTHDSPPAPQPTIAAPTTTAKTTTSAHATTRATTTSATAAQYVTVQSGDTYGSIASANGTSVQQLEELNPGVSPTALTVLTIMGSSNAVNLTDGLDGLAIGCTLIVAAVFLAFTYIAGNFKFAEYLQVPFVSGAGELTVFCAAMIGAGLGFLWFNCHPAQVFMGDTGSLALGYVLAAMAIQQGWLILIPLVGLVFVLETLSVIIQVAYFKASGGRRVFKMTPIHYTFHHEGWSENRIALSFWGAGLISALAAVALVKLVM